jgi:hypothetical protein
LKRSASVYAKVLHHALLFVDINKQKSSAIAGKTA